MKFVCVVLVWLTGCINHHLVSAHGDRRGDLDDDHCKLVQTIDVQPGIQTLTYTSPQDFQRNACFYWKFRVSSSDQIWLNVLTSQQFGHCPRAKLLLTDDDHEIMFGGRQWRQPQTTSFWSKEQEVQVFFKPSSCDRSFSLQHQAVSGRNNQDRVGERDNDDDDDDDKDDDRKAPSTRLLVGTISGAIAVLAVVILVIIVAICIRRRRRCRHAAASNPHSGAHVWSKPSGYISSTAAIPITPRGPPDLYAAPYDDSAPYDKESFKKAAPPGDGTEYNVAGGDRSTAAPPSLVVPVAPPPYSGPGLFTTDPSGVSQELPPSYRDATYQK